MADDPSSYIHGPAYILPRYAKVFPTDGQELTVSEKDTMRSLESVSACFEHSQFELSVTDGKLYNIGNTQKIPYDKVVSQRHQTRAPDAY